MNNVGSVFVMRRGRSRVVVGMNGWLVSVKRSYPIPILSRCCCMHRWCLFSINLEPREFYSLCPSCTPLPLSSIHLIPPPIFERIIENTLPFSLPPLAHGRGASHTPSSTLSISGLWNRHQPPSPEGELVRHDGPISLRVEVVLQ